mgnify:CR=1 FL=1
MRTENNEIYNESQRSVALNTPNNNYYRKLSCFLFLVFLNFLDRWKAEDKIHLGTNATWLNPEDNHYYFRLDSITEELQRKRISYELRKLTHYLREEHGAEPIKITLNKKEIRCWKIHKDELNKVNKQSLGKAEIVRKTMDAEFEKSKNAF